MWYGYLLYHLFVLLCALWVVTHGWCSSSEGLCTSGILLSVFLSPNCLPTIDCQLAVKLQLCIRVFWCLLLLWSVNTFHFRMSGETNSSTSSISRTRSKCCNSRKLKSMRLLNHRKSVQPSGITLFYTRTLCWVSWYPWWSDAPLPRQSSRPSNFIEVTLKYS